MPAAAETVTGSVTWRERMALPPGAVLEVTVEDISRADAPSVALARFAVAPVGSPPLAFELDVPAPDPRATVSVRASIRDGARLLFTTDTVSPVLTRGATAQVDLMLVGVDVPPGPGILGTDWRIVALAGTPLPSDAGDAALRIETAAHGTVFSASVGCNRLGGPVQMRDDTVTFGPVRSTRMACPPPLDAAEKALAEALARAARWQIDGTSLRLLEASGAVVLEAAAP